MAIEPTQACSRHIAVILAVSALTFGLGAGAAEAQQRSNFQVRQPSVSVQRSVIPQPRPTLQQRLQAERLSRNRGVDYDTVRSWQKRQDAQNQHQRNLDADRASDSLPLRDLAVPRMQRNCQNAITGNKYMPPPCR